MSTLYFTGVDDGEHFTEVDKFPTLFEAVCSYHELINDGAVDGETVYKGVELGQYLFVDTEDEEMETIDFHEFN